MENTINIGIDLGTTNSAIAKFVKGEVMVFTNPQDFGRSTLPSVVGFRKDKILVGNQAKSFLEKDPKSVIGIFKRKMGTSESFKIKSIDESKSPIDLSAFVLKELKTFVITDNNIDAAVITIPASFDIIQSNATKEAGHQAGFKQVVLLQEPIAASLAYANLKKNREMKDGLWLVYDLGGGTFDVALMQIKQGEMKVVDHEGNNFLGGVDFDRLIVDKILFPKLKKNFEFDNLEEDMKSASGKYNTKYYILQHRSEEAKINLSAKLSSEVIIDGFKDENEKEIDLEIAITRSEFNDLIAPYIEETIEMIKKILTRNSLKPNEIQFTLMVGGSTYIPYVRKRVEEVLDIPVNIEIDPTTAVAIGAAFFAGTKTKDLPKIKKDNSDYKISIRSAYPKVSKEKEELFAAKITGDTQGLFYRITRDDGGFDTSLKKLSEKISEDLPLVENAYNFFNLVIYDDKNNIIETGFEMIGINSGFGTDNPPLTDDICLEVDDVDNIGDTKLELIFQKNTGLPLKKRVTKILNKNVIKGAESDVIYVNIYEGPQTSLPAANKLIGAIKISGKQISRDITKGSDIEFTISLSESRDLLVSAYLNMSDQEFKNVFIPKERHTSIDVLKIQVDDLSEKLIEEIDQATEKEDYETAAILNKLTKNMDAIVSETEELTIDDVTDKKYQLEDKKRKIAQEIDSATKKKRIQVAKEHYINIKKECIELIDNDGNDYERKALANIESQEKIFFSSNSPLRIQEKTEELYKINSQIRWRTPNFLKDIFNWLKSEQSKMNNQQQAKTLIESGNLAFQNQNWDRIREINIGLLDLLPNDSRAKMNTKIGF